MYYLPCLCSRQFEEDSLLGDVEISLLRLEDTKTRLTSDRSTGVVTFCVSIGDSTTIRLYIRQMS